MRIPDVKGLISLANTRLETTKRPQPAAVERRDGTADKVELSSQSQLTGKLVEQGRDSAKAHEQARIAAMEQLKQELSSGGIKVDSESIAHRMLEEGIFNDLIGGTR
jgi:anti-sigma28 factor (negative regulator of flagellin synthesis)